MRASLFSVVAITASLATANTVIPRAACNADNCLRAVTGTAGVNNKPVLTLRQADCSSFLAATVTPGISTITVTATATVTSGPQRRAVDSHGNEIGEMEKRVVTAAAAVPTYASACSGGVRYSSACSCFGITAYTVTAAAPSTTTTVTATVTVAPAVGCSNPGSCPNYTACSYNTNSGCVCVFDVEGNSVCTTTIACPGASQCSHNSDCSAGHVCEVNSCCGYNICSPASIDCPNSANPTRLFKERKRGENLSHGSA
ncbi:hypothetical protein BP5796_04299 [Coleophoma crateriformis]|uniref:Uncharacterized protein n=1 Tax=Coleophoma crateriformis TaxID=565419 RepID=A0A3D8SIG4_9HELO|nr:hypothetical protein BP5796_04299 [Coleophoma crateriformis]